MRQLRRFNDRRGWLSELFRQDELSAEFYPVMSYISSTNPGVARGSHEHVDQADLVNGIVTNFPNHLYMGVDRREEIDEIRHEDDPGTIFRMDD